MIIPSKHINFSKSLLGFGSYILLKLEKPISIDDLWSSYKEDVDSQIYNYLHTFDNLIMALIFLYSIDAITEKNGIISKCN